jgi:DNA polymerase-3 subunit alpha
MPAVAITDHGNMFGVMEFYKTALKENVKPIIGMEAYVSKQPIGTKFNGGNIKKIYNHLVLLAKNLHGYKNLIKLATFGYLQGFYYRPLIDDAMLEEHSEGLIGLSGCLKGIIPELLINDRRNEAVDRLKKYLDIFNGEFYLEIMDHGIDEEIIARQHLLDLSQDMSVPVVATNDSHYLKKEHAEAHEVMLCIQTQTTMSDPNRFKLSSHEMYFKTGEEMEQLFIAVPEAIENTRIIADKCNVLLDHGKFYLPKSKIPEPDIHLGADKYLEKLAYEGLAKRFPKIDKKLDHRLAEELSVIQRMRFSDYFLVVKDFTDFAKKNGIPVGPGRGSAAGSLVSYALGITNIDPLRYGLLFERFLNKDRVTMPDIDMDFCFERRDEVIKYVKQRYGEDCVSQIITFGSMNARAVVRDVGRAMDVPLNEVDRLAKMIPTTVGVTLKYALETINELRTTVESNPIYKQMFEYAQIFEGMARHASTHAAGVVIAPEPLINYLPLYKSQKTDEITTQYSMNYIEDIGLLKMDILGLRTLTVINDCVDMVRNKGVNLDLEKIPLDDKKTYELFAKGHTVGVFQFEGSGMRDYLRKLKPETIEDLTAMNALYRPGPLSNNMVDDFIKRKHGENPIEYIHPKLESILRETYGVIIYQEQVMQIAGELAGFSLGHADILRRAMGKKNSEMMRQKKEEFVAGCVKNNVSKTIANELFDLIDKFAGYGFNKSHSAGYALVAYQTAYLKTYYPCEFMAATMSSEMDQTDRIVRLIEECSQMDIPLLPPDIMKSEVKFAVETEGVRFGLGAIKNVGQTAAQALINEREKFKNDRHFYKLCENIDVRVINKKVLESLIQAGALDSIEGSRSQKITSIDRALAYAQYSQAEKEKGQTNIFGSGEEQQGTLKEYPPLTADKEWLLYETLAHEKDVLGFYLSGHPLDKYRDEVESLSSHSIADLPERDDGVPVRLGCIITQTKILPTKRDVSKTIAFITIEDYTGAIDATLFSETYAKYRALVKPDAVVFIRGKLSKREEGKPKVLVDELIPIESARSLFAKKVIISLTAQGLEPVLLKSLVGIVQKSPGKCELIIEVAATNNARLTMKSGKYKINPDTVTLAQLRDILGEDSVRLAV